MTTHVHQGPNKTGSRTNVVDESETADFAALVPPSADGDGQDLSRMRVLYAREAHAPIGTVPPPASVKGVVKTAMQRAMGRDPDLLIDKLGARLAFERTGTRLYDALLSKHLAYGSWASGPTQRELELLRRSEQEHMQRVIDAVVSIGADPTACTPGADLDAWMLYGLVQLVSDPRTTLAECLEAALVAELADAAGWETLIMVCGTFGQRALVESFQSAYVEEERHVALVKTWLREHHVLVAKSKLD